MAKTFRDLTRDGDSKQSIEPTIKRTDAGMFIRRKNIHVQPGFNRRSPSVELTDHIRSLANAIKVEVSSGAKDTRIPALFVSVREEGGVWMRDGHCRLGGYDLAAAEGCAAEWIPIAPFVGTPAQAKAFTISSNNQLQTSPYDRAMTLQDLRDDPEFFIDGKPLTTTQIADLVGVSRQYVERLLKVADAPAEIREAVLKGEVTANVAAQILVKHGDDAPKLLAAEVEKAKAVGKKAITNNTLKGRPIPRDLADNLSSVAIKLRDALPPAAREAIQAFRQGSDVHQTVTLDVRLLNELLAVQEELDRVRADQQEKAERKAAQTAQQAANEGAAQAA